MTPTAREPTPPSDLLSAPTASFEPPPLIDSELPPLRPAETQYKSKASLLDHTPGTRRLENLDALRIVCMGAIITTHVTERYLDAANLHSRATASIGEIMSPLYLATLAVNVCGRFGVPCFMMISFYIYWHQLYEKGRTWGELLKRRLSRLLPAFICWSSFYFAIHKTLYWKFGHRWDSSMYEYRLSDWHTWYTVYVLGRAEIHLYYLPLVIECLLLIPLLRLLWKKPVIAWGWVIAATLAWVIGCYGVLLPAGSPGRLFSAMVYNKLTDPRFYPLFFLMFPLMGLIFAGQTGFRKFVANSSNAFWIGLLIFGLVLHAGESILLTRLLPEDIFRSNVLVKAGRIISAIAVFGLFIRHPLMRDPLPRVSHYAFGLHFLHPAVILMLSIVELKLLGPAIGNWQQWILPMLIVNLVLTFSITFALCLLIGRWKRLEFLVV